MGRRTLLLPSCALLWWCSSPPSVPPIDQANLGAVPAAPDAGATTSTTVTTFALNALWLGDTTRDGTEDLYGAWRSFGYDLDGRVTIEDSTNICALANNSRKSIQIDGNDGIDNSFGANVLLFLMVQTGTTNLSSDATSLIGAGTWTLQLRVAGLPADLQQSATGLSAQAFVSGAFNGSPAFDATTDWPVLASSVSDGATVASGALVRFATVYVNGGTVVARDATQPLSLPVALWNYPGKPKAPELSVLTLRIHDPILTFVRSDATSAAQGTIAGVLDTKEIQAATTMLGDALGSCDGIFGSAFADTQEILSDGTNAPDTPCDAISIGIGFTAKVVANPTQVGGSLPRPACPGDAGAEGGADAGVEGGADATGD